MIFKEAFHQRIEEINSALNDQFDDTTTCKHQAMINKAMRYTLLNGGKRIRPIILVEVVSIFFGNKKDALSLGCALEMIHSYSLIHDDLPAMDDDDIRRGKPSNHVTFGEDIGILAGDGLLNGAYEIMFNNVLINEATSWKVKACQKIATAAGSRGMILGQVADIKMQERSIATLDYVNMHKTGALIEAAFVAGGYLSNSDEIERLSLIGQNLGKGFQIQDDVLDVVGDEETLGKPIGSDQKNDKQTYVDLLGIEGAITTYNECYNTCIEELKEIPNSEFLIGLIHYLKNRNK